MLGFVALPAFLYAVGARDKNTKLIRWTAAWTVLGIVVNRFNVSMVAFNYHLPSSERYFPHWMEIGYFGIYRHRGHSGVPLHRDPYAHSLRTPGLRIPLAAGLAMAGNRPAG
jgi:hypothetical protein